MTDYDHADALHDYPNATGHPSGQAEQMPNFETSVLFILLYAYQKLTDDTAYAQQYTSLLEGYAQYLAPRSLYPAAQLISVDFIRPRANETGLAIQSVIGLNAAGLVTGNQTYSDLASQYAYEIYERGLGLDGSTPSNSTHFTFVYDNNNSWNVLFPAFSDVVLNLSTFPASAWALQSDWYETQFQAGGLPFADPVFGPLGRPMQRFKWGLTDWNVVAAAVSSDSVKRQAIDTTHAFLTNGKNSIPFGTRHVVEGPRAGLWTGNKNRAM